MDQGRPAGPQGPWALPTVVSSGIHSLGSAAESVHSMCCLVPAFVVSVETPPRTLWALGGQGDIRSIVRAPTPTTWSERFPCVLDPQQMCE